MAGHWTAHTNAMASDGLNPVSERQTSLCVKCDWSV